MVMTVKVNVNDKMIKGRIEMKGTMVLFGNNQKKG
jgi:hypothetical protein